MHYLRGWFFIDLVSTVPWDYLALLSIHIATAVVRGVGLRLYVGLRSDESG